MFLYFCKDFILSVPLYRNTVGGLLMDGSDKIGVLNIKLIAIYIKVL